MGHSKNHSQRKKCTGCYPSQMLLIILSIRPTPLMNKPLQNSTNRNPNRLLGGFGRGSVVKEVLSALITHIEHIKILFIYLCSVADSFIQSHAYKQFP